jgi:hypothetical protein
MQSERRESSDGRLVALFVAFFIGKLHDPIALSRAALGPHVSVVIFGTRDKARSSADPA